MGAVQAGKEPHAQTETTHPPQEFPQPANSRPFLKPHPPIGRVESARSKLIMKTALPPTKTIVPKAFRVMFDDDAGESTAGISDSTTTAPPTAIIHSAVNNFSLDATYFGR